MNVRRIVSTLYKIDSTIIIVLLLSGFVFGANPPTVDEIAGKLSCYCGTCPHLVVSQCGCSTADQIKTDIRKMIGQGLSEEQILQTYIAQHGETVLAAPPRSGFNLTAWSLPFIAFIGGGIVLFAFLKRQQKPKKPDKNEPPEKPKDDDNEELYRKRIDEELEKRK